MRKYFKDINKAQVLPLLDKAERKFAERGKKFDYNLTEPNPGGTTFELDIRPTRYAEWVFAFIEDKVPSVNPDIQELIREHLKTITISAKNTLLS